MMEYSRVLILKEGHVRGRSKKLKSMSGLCHMLLVQSILTTIESFKDVEANIYTNNLTTVKQTYDK